MNSVNSGRIVQHCVTFSLKIQTLFPQSSHLKTLTLYFKWQTPENRPQLWLLRVKHNIKQKNSTFALQFCFIYLSLSCVRTEQWVIGCEFHMQRTWEWSNLGGKCTSGIVACKVPLISASLPFTSSSCSLPRIIMCCRFLPVSTLALIR